MPAGYSKIPAIFSTIPPQPPEKKPGQLNPDQLRQYFEEGYVLLPEFFTDEELQPVIESISQQVDRMVDKLFDAGKIKNKHKDASFYKRLTLIEQEFPGAAIVLHKNAAMTKAIQDVWSNERLLNIVEQLIGPDISGHPVWNLRTKVPKNEELIVPWHQDNAYFSEDAKEILMPTAWIPLLDARRVNGCMEVAKGRHKKAYLGKHVCCAGSTLYVEIPEEELINALEINLEEDVVLCEVPFGGMLLFNNMIPHRSLENNSDQIRWSLDLRWMAPAKQNGFYGLKDNVLMRTSKDPNHKIDWETFTKEDRHALENASHMDAKAYELEPIIVGPWMGAWEIVHHNKHTQAYLKEQQDNAKN